MLCLCPRIVLSAALLRADLRLGVYEPGEAGPALAVPPCGEVPSPAPSSRASGAAWWPASGKSGMAAAATALFAVGAGAVAGRARTLRDEP